MLRNSDVMTSILHCWQSKEFSSALHASEKVEDTSAESYSMPEINAHLPSERKLATTPAAAMALGYVMHSSSILYVWYILISL